MLQSYLEWLVCAQQLNGRYHKKTQANFAHSPRRCVGRPWKGARPACGGAALPRTNTTELVALPLKRQMCGRCAKKALGDIRTAVCLPMIMQLPQYAPSWRCFPGLPLLRWGNAKGLRHGAQREINAIQLLLKAYLLRICDVRDKSFCALNKRSSRALTIPLCWKEDGCQAKRNRLRPVCASNARST